MTNKEILPLEETTFNSKTALVLPRQPISVKDMREYLANLPDSTLLVPDARPEITSLYGGRLIVNRPNCNIFVDGQDVSVSAGQYRILSFMTNAPGRVFPRSDIHKNMVGDSFSGERSIDVQMYRIRRILGEVSIDLADQQVIGTVKGIGYKINTQLSAA